MKYTNCAELPPDPTTFTIAGMLVEWIIVPATLSGIIGVATLINYIFAGFNSALVVWTTGVLSFVAAIAMGGLFRNKGIGRLTVWFLGCSVCILFYISFLLGRGISVLPLFRTTRMDLSVVLFIQNGFYWWVFVALLIAHEMAIGPVRLLHLRIQKVTVVIRNILIVCGLVFVVLNCFTPNSLYGYNNIPVFLYTHVLKARVAEYQQSHLGLQKRPDGLYEDRVEKLGRINSPLKLLRGAGERLVSGPYAIRHDQSSDVWFIETFPREPRPKNTEDYYTRMLVRGSDGLVLAKW